MTVFDSQNSTTSFSLDWQQKPITRSMSLADFIHIESSDSEKKAAMVDGRKWLGEQDIGLPPIANLRLAMGLSQQDLARKMKTSQSRVSNIESGDDIRVSTIKKLAQALERDSIEIYKLIAEGLKNK